MSLLSSVVQASPPGKIETRLRGPWLNIARIGTVALALASLALLFIMLPAILAFLETPCADGSCPLTPAQA